LTERLVIPLQVGGIQDGKSISEDFTLNWEMPPGWPQDWSVTLMDHKRNKGISMKNRSSYTFWHASSPAGILMQSLEENTLQAASSPHQMDLKLRNPVKPAGIVAPENSIQYASGFESISLQSKPEEVRFTIVIDPGEGSYSGEYLPIRPELLQNYPNPFNSSTNIRVALPDNQDVVLEVYDMIGRRVTTLANGQFSAGTHNFTWDAAGAASGLYIYRLRSGQTIQSKKMLLVK
jgi:hypothetical protein